ncbi:MAG: 50S ribosome-binding GTPase [Verrucomicrobiales bacterium]|nr:50S ribosome-binding GTPase [Verrucomicrobiales bacterium]
MLGQQYFNIRTNLRDSVGALAQLAEQCELSSSSVTKVRNVLASLKDPFRFVVLGEAETGKSTLINALFGEDICPLEEAPALTPQIAVYQYGKEAHDFDVSDSLLECYRPLDVLQDFSVTDVPGDGSIKRHRQELIDDILPDAHFILVVFPVTDPWSPTTWKMLEALHQKWQHKIVLILQQCDRRSDEEIDAILEHLRRTSNNRCGTQFPTFAVSGKKALLAKTSGLDKVRLARESRISQLENHISQEINHSSVHLEKMDKGCVLAKTVIKEVQDKLHTPAEIIRADDELFATLEVRAEQQQARTEGKFEPVFSAFDTAFMNARLQTDRLLDKHMGVLSSLKAAGDLPAEVESIITTATLEQVKITCEEAALVAEADVRQLWDELSADMQRDFKLKLSVGKKGEPDWSGSRKRLVKHVADATEGELENPYLRDGLKKFFRRRRRRMISYLLLSLTLVAGGAWLWWQQLSPYDIAAFSASALALLMSVLEGFKGSARIRTFFSKELDAQRTRLHDTLRTAFNEGVDECYRDFVRLFDPIRKVCSKQREKYQPLLQASDELQGSFKHLEDELWKQDRKTSATK